MKPAEIFEDAERLLQTATEEAQFRAVASRAYIAAFQHTLRHPKLAGFQPSKTGDDHRDLIEHLKRSRDHDLRMVGLRQIPRLRAIRNHADYDLDIAFTRGLADEALERAAEIIYELLPAER